MEKTDKLNAYYNQEHPFKDGIAKLRKLALQTDCTEDFKWSIPVYTVNGKNIFGICRFKHHFGIWFFNGVFLSDPKKMLRNAQEGKTKGMRHWNFHSANEIDSESVLLYMIESIENQKQGKEITIEKTKKEIKVPELLANRLSQSDSLKSSFEKLSLSKQREFCVYIAEAKQEKTKIRRLDKIVPMIQKGVGLNDAYK
ncbi:YdeI/OmpD-associated family protein [Flagellimonas sp. HMM57]|uniref:YdeI/OmpD-associated family protein n=1 Tax=unclassified Flagellimonas TaxID=2644544 RepID=UPI0013D08D18|nr:MULTISPECIES: DUF1801 domain-containing protein [unclassified Flagellimonas]UII75142.1 YdeI/OmpD-associated family protein [Flagellimonas sp. HMM57]